MSKLPVISGDKLIKLLGYEIVRQKGSHIRLRNKIEICVHNITMPKHRIAKGTLNDIPSKASLWNNKRGINQNQKYER